MGSDLPSHLPPQNLEAEEAILGAMLTSRSAVEVAMDLGLREGDFYRSGHRTIFRVILDLFARDAVDELTVVNELRRRSQLSDVGGAAAVMTLAERVPAVANARAYAQEVIDQATLRGLVETGHEIARLGYEHPDEPVQLVDMAGTLVGDLSSQRDTGDFVDASTLLEPIYDELAERAEKGQMAAGLLTGFHELDKRTGGLRPGNLVIVAGRPAMGKTSWAMNVAENVAMSGEGAVAVFSLEMSPDDLMTRMMCSVAKVDQHRIRTGVPAEQDWPHLVEAVGKLSPPDRLFIADTRDLTPMSLRAKCRRLHRQLANKGGLKLIIIDYLQIMEGGRRFGGRTEEITYISRQLKSLALELGVPVIAMSQLNRAVEQRNPPRPMLSDLRESGAIEQDADMVLLLYRPEYYLRSECPPEWEGKAELIVAKLRNGEPGSAVLGFLGRYTKFVNLTVDAARDAWQSRPGRGPQSSGAPTGATPATPAQIAAAGFGADAASPEAPDATRADPLAAPDGGGSFGPAPGEPFAGEDFGLPAPPPDAGYEEG